MASKGEGGWRVGKGEGEGEGGEMGGRGSREGGMEGWRDGGMEGWRDGEWRWREGEWRGGLYTVVVLVKSYNFRMTSVTAGSSIHVPTTPHSSSLSIPPPHPHTFSARLSRAAQRSHFSFNSSFLARHSSYLAFSVSMPSSTSRRRVFASLRIRSVSSRDSLASARAACVCACVQHVHVYV